MIFYKDTRSTHFIQVKIRVRKMHIAMAVLCRPKAVVKHMVFFRYQ